MRTPLLCLALTLLVGCAIGPKPEDPLEADSGTFDPDGALALDAPKTDTASAPSDTTASSSDTAGGSIDAASDGKDTDAGADGSPDADDARDASDAAPDAPEGG